MSVDQKQIILEQSSLLFFRNGVRTITMDYIAKRCKVSKKTIYKYFQNKNDLLFHIIVFKIEELTCYLEKNKENSVNALEALIYFFNEVNTILSTVNPSFGKELRKHHPNALMKLLHFKLDTIIPFIKENIEQGKKEGLYSEDIREEEICDSFDNISNVVFVNEFLFNKSTDKKAIHFLNSLFLHRLVSPRGLQLLNKDKYKGVL